MKTSITTLAVLSMVAAGSSLWSSTISFSSRPTVNELTFASADGYRDNWAALVADFPVAPAGYGEASIETWDATNPVTPSNQGLVGGTSQRIAFKYTVDFCVDDMKDGGEFSFRIAPDFGWGGAVFLDGVEVGFNDQDMWWSGDWNNTSQLFEFGASLGAGLHRIEVYGQEPCCDGGTSGQYSFEGGDWNSFSTNDSLQCVTCACPEGGANVALLGGVLGMIAAGRSWRRRSA